MLACSEKQGNFLSRALGVAFTTLFNSIRRLKSSNVCGHIPLLGGEFSVMLQARITMLTLAY